MPPWRRASAHSAGTAAWAGFTVPEAIAPGRAREGARNRRPGGHWALAWLSAGALALAVASLAFPSTPSYDPWSWLLWGREIVHLNLRTPGGPSWKPLPALFTTIFAPFGTAQPDLWLVIARAGAGLAVALAFRLAWRLTYMLEPGWARANRRAAARALRAAAPLLAGVIAAGSLLNSPGFISDNALGYSEGLASALLLAAFDQLTDRRPRAAFALGFFAALDRPELWFFWVPCGFYLLWRKRSARALVLAAFALIPLLWFGPELWGSGHLFRSVTRALAPSRNSPAFASCPVCAEFRQVAWPQLLLRVKVPAIAAGLAALWELWRARGASRKDALARKRDRACALLAALAGLGYLWWFGIAVETQAGFSGNVRYLVLGTAPLAVAGGAAWGWFALAIATRAARLRSHPGDGPGADLGPLAPRLRWRAGSTATSPRGCGSLSAIPAWASLAAGTGAAIAVFLATPPWLGQEVISLPRTRAALVYQAHLRADVAALVERFGRQRLLGCGNGVVMTEAFQVPMVAWYLRVPLLRVEEQPASTQAPPSWPSVILQTRAVPGAPLEPAPATIRRWRSFGARYERVGQRTFRLLLDCRK
jgi:hypothetical protein